MSDRIRQQRIMAGISGALLSQRAGIQRSKLSDIERGYIVVPQHELDRIESVLNGLIDAKQKVESVARECGWPVAAL